MSMPESFSRKMGRRCSFSVITSICLSGRPLAEAGGLRGGGKNPGTAVAAANVPPVCGHDK